MARDTFDNAPQGLRRSRKGWLRPVPNPRAAQVRRLQDENADLRALLGDMEKRLAALEKKKGRA